MVLIVIPIVIIVLAEGLHIGWGLPCQLAVAPVLLAVALMGIGLSLIGWTIGLFAAVGHGTLAPWDPTQRLVVRSVYRHVRNPMISSVLLTLLGEAALLGSLSVLVWAGIFFLANALYIPLIEERGLESRFGEDYRAYRENVPRWIPRLRAWHLPPGAD